MTAAFLAGLMLVVPAAAAQAPPSTTQGGDFSPAGDLPTVGDVPSRTTLPGGPAGSRPVASASVPGATGSSTTSTTAVPPKDVELEPVVHCVWISPDMDPLLEGHQYERSGLADDLPDVPTPTPCSLDTASGSPTLVPVTVPVASVKPNGGDRPGTRAVELWTAVSHATGPDSIDSIELALRRADGSLLSVGATERLASDADLSGPLGAGVVSGQMSAAAADGMVELLADRWLLPVRAVLPLSVGDGCGEVTLEVTAVSGGRQTTASIPVEVLCFHQLLTDFDTVDWGNLVPGAESVAVGDSEVATPSRPTIANIGNAPMALATTFQPLCLVADPTVCLGEFGYELALGESAAVRQDPRPPAQEMTDPDVWLCPGAAARIDFLAAVPAGAVDGDYLGSVRVVGVSAPDGSCVPGGGGTPTTTGAASTTAAGATTSAISATTALPTSTDPSTP